MPARLTAGDNRQRMPDFTEHFIAGFNHDLGGILYTFLNTDQRFVIEQRDSIELTTETALGTVDALHRSLDSNVSRPVFYSICI